MITYDYAMFASGDNWRFEKSYASLAAQFAKDKNKYNTSKVFLTTNERLDSVDNMFVFDVPDFYPIYCQEPEKQYTHDFNYNIKFLAIDNAFKKSTAEYIIYIDSDFVFSDSYSEENLQKFLEECKKNRYDIITPRSSNGYRPAYDHKYDALGFSSRDSIMTFQEGYIVFRNTYKLNFFIQKWEELYWKMQHKQLQQFSEGLEIGIAARYADFHFSEDLEKTYYLFRNYLNGAFWSLETKDKKTFFW